MTKYLLVDTANTFFRARHIAMRGTDSWEKLGLAIHITLNAVSKCWQKQKADHVVFCLEGRSWRKDIYEPYKKNRKIAQQSITEEQAIEDELFWKVFAEFSDFLSHQTNCSVLQHPIAEADDLIARWIHKHPNDENCIVSSDSDFFQLLTENVTQYNGITQELHTLNGIFDDKGNTVIDKKTKEPKLPPDPEWLLFEKCMRGDKSDNIFSAYPGVRTKGTKNRVGLKEAFEDRNTKGYSWNNMMLQRWQDHNEQEHKVLDDYNRNVELIDLTKQPDDVKMKLDDYIKENAKSKQKEMVGVRFMKFCGKYELKNISENITRYVDFLQADYKDEK